MTPTQAQIEAAAKAFHEIGEKDNDWIKKRADIRASAIERCAQVAEKFEINLAYPATMPTIEKVLQKIAAAIRALKDQQT